MALQVVGAGTARTGTTSLKGALERLLGAPCHHMLEVIKSPAQQAGWIATIDGERDWETLLSGFVAAVDWPASLYWTELTEAYPDALVVLSQRPAEKWYESLSNTIIPQWDNPAPALKVWLEKLGEVLDERFCFDYHDAAAMMAAYEKHNQLVRDTIPADRLLEWTAGDGWAPLCERLGVPVPAEDFPRANTTEQFRSMSMTW